LKKECKILLKDYGETKTLVKYVLLSYKLSENIPLYGNTPTIEILFDKNMENGDSCNTSILKFHNHSGTHIDAPKHFWNEGRCIADYSFDELVFNSPLVIDRPKSPKEMINVKDITGFEKKLENCDILLLRTGFWKYRSKKIYRLADYIRSKFENIRCIGLDSLSVSNYSNRELGRETHEIFLRKNEYAGEPVLLLEDLDLSRKDLDKLKTILICPLMIENIDSAPCMVIGIFE
jgi:kynurenine formamidase